MSVQTTITNIRRSLPGILQDVQQMEKASFILEDATLEFGKPVTRGTNPDRQAKLPSTGGDLFLGITIRDGSLENLTVGSNLAVYKEGQTMSILRQGAINVVASVAVAPDEPVYFYHTANATYLPGDFVNADDAGFTTLIPNADWQLTTTAPGELSFIRLK